MRSWKTIALGCASLGLAVAVDSSANATCTPLPYTFSSGTAAVATQVNSDLQGILSCPLFTGYTGIGTSTPSAPLDVSMGGTTHSYPQIRADGNGDMMLAAQGSLFFDGNYSYASGSYIGEYSTTSGTYDANTQKFSTSGVERMRINSAGNVGIGTVSPSMTFYVYGTAGGSNAWSTPSDLRLKKDITNITDGLDLVEKLRGVRFRWRTPEERKVGKTISLAVDHPQIGFIAQEVADVVPEAVNVPAKGSSDLYSLRESDLIPVLVEAIKEQQAEIKQQQAEIDQLQQKLNKAAP